MDFDASNEFVFSSGLKSWLEEITTSKLLTLFEPEKEVIPDVRIGQARYVATKLAKSSDDSFRFWCNISRKGRLSLFHLLPTRQALLPIPAGSWPSGR